MSTRRLVIASLLLALVPPVGIVRGQSDAAAPAAPTAPLVAHTPAVTTPTLDARQAELLRHARACSCPGDFNNDNIINSADLVAFLAVFSTACNTDADGDGVPDTSDNCPNTPNPLQADADADAVGDVCDNCLNTPNPSQADCDNDAIGDACEGQSCSSPSQCPLVPNATFNCVMGQCQYTCITGWADCNGNILLDGCERPVLSDNFNCGACSLACPSGTRCVNGLCVTNCGLGFTNCAGVCRDLLTDRSNCGACGFACPAGPNQYAGCHNGQCFVGCTPGYADCDGNAANGCEVFIGGDPTNCGACCAACVLPNATATCVNGQCQIGSCNAGFFDCNAVAADGCEANVQTNPQNCGSCGFVCPNPPNATAACLNGQCVIGSCNAGFADCNGVFSDGCEVNINTSPVNCGACGDSCGPIPNGTVACVNGGCAVGSCNNGFADCDANPINGCETDVNTSVNNCGNCGVVCTPGPRVTSVSCVNGNCKITGCQTGWFDANGIFSDGCESNSP